MHKDFWRENARNGQSGETGSDSFGTFGSFDSLDSFGGAQAASAALYGREDAEYAENGEDADRRLQSDLLTLAKMPQGRRFLKHLLDTAGVFEPMPVNSQALYAYCEGRRSMGLMLYRRLYALGPQYIIQIQGEQ